MRNHRFFFSPLNFIFQVLIIIFLFIILIVFSITIYHKRGISSKRIFSSVIIVHLIEGLQTIIFMPDKTSLAQYKITLNMLIFHTLWSHTITFTPIHDIRVNLVYFCFNTLIIFVLKIRFLNKRSYSYFIFKNIHHFFFNWSLFTLNW